MSDVTPLRILILDDQPELARVMRDVLRPQGFEVRAADTALTAMASARAAPPAVVLVRWDMPQGEASRFMELFRGASPGAVIVLTTGQPGEDDDRELKKAVRRYAVGRVLHRPFSILDLPAVVKASLADAPADSASMLGRRPHADTLRALGQVWLERESGTATSLGGLVARFNQGAAADGESQALVEDILRDGVEISFRRGEVVGGGDLVALATALWRAALAVAEADPNPQALIDRPNHMERLAELPLKPATLRALQAADGATELRALCAAQRCSLTEIGPDLGALTALGLVHQRVKATAGTEALLTLRRLRRERDRLMTDDAWTVLGLAPTGDKAKIDEAAARMRARYGQLQRDPGLSDECHNLAAEILRRVAEAAAEVGERPALPAAAPAPEDNTERAWRAGLDAMAKRRWPDAVRAFRTAHSAVIDRPDFMAHLGWAIFNDTGRGPTRVEEALELLELAESFDERAALTQLWLATVEAHAQRLSRARARLTRLMGRADTDTTAEAQELLQQVQQKLARPPEG
ncbi:MAG: response regulator [Deltaproteobacteria bacterium]|nr:response regulator [Deltaproteobacteria bacterium]